MFRWKIFSTLLLAVALALTFGATSASADTTDISLSVPNSDISGFTGPYGNVHIDLNAAGTAATITLTSLTNSGNIYLFGDGSTLALNTVGTATASSIVGTNGGTGFTNAAGDSTQSSPVPTATQNVDGFGSFNMVIDTFDGFKHAVDKLTFTLTKDSGSWSSAANVVTPNAQGATAVGHVFVTSSPAIQSNGAVATGFAANGGAVPIPEPSTMAIAGLGALGFMGYGLRRRLKK